MLTIQGDKALPQYTNGETVIIKKIFNDYNIGDIVIIKDPEKGFQIRKVSKVESDVFTFIDGEIGNIENIIGKIWFSLGDFSEDK